MPTVKTAITISLALALAGCAARPHIAGCEIFKPITFSAAGDTPSTIMEIRSHNAAGRAAGCW